MTEPKSYWEQQAIFWKDKFYDRSETEIGIIYGQSFNLAHAELLETYGNEKDIKAKVSERADFYFDMLMIRRKSAISKHSTREQEIPVEKPAVPVEFKTADKVVMPDL